MATSNVVQSLWVGNRLSLMEQLCIRSFLHHGHEFQLYTYGPCDGVPPGTMVKDADEIIPADRICVYEHGFGKGSPAVFADLFRYALLLGRGGWWVDLDGVALRRFEFAESCILGTSGGRSGHRAIQTAVIHVPAGSELMTRCLAVAERSTGGIRWGEIGPRLLGRISRELHLADAAQPSSTFYPIRANRVWDLVSPNRTIRDAFGVHLWHALWKHFGLDPDGRYPETSLYERWIAAYLPEAVREKRRPVNVAARRLLTIPVRGFMAIKTAIRRTARRLKLR